MPKPAITNGEEHFFNLVYTGTGTGQTIGRFLPFTNNGTIDKSCVFDSAASPALARSLGSNGDRTKFTISTWIKRGKLLGSGFMSIITGGTTSTHDGIFFNSSEQIYTYFFGAEALTTTRTFEDCSKWYHIVLRADSSLSTADDRVRMYIDGDQITSFATRNNPSQDATTGLFLNSSNNIRIGRHGNDSFPYYGDYYLAETLVADGQSYGPDTFGITDTSTGQWIPKDISSGITYGTHGFRMNYANSAGQTIGDDSSGNGNDMTVTNITASNISINTPTKNFPVVDIGTANTSANFTTANGNMIVTSPAGTTSGVARLTMRLPKSGKWIVPFKLRSPVGAQTVNSYRNEGNGSIFFGAKEAFESTVYANNHESAYGMFVIGGLGGSNPQYPGTASIIAGSQGSTVNQTGNMGGGYHHWALDIDNGKAWLYLYDGSGAGTSGYMNGPDDNSSFDGDPAAGTGQTLSIPFKDTRFDYYIGVEDSSGSANYYIDWALDMTTTENVPTATINAGFKNISQDEFPTDPDDRGVPALAWFKHRNGTGNHLLVDSSRGGNKQLQPNLTNAELTQEDMIQKFLPGGYFVEDFVNLNNNEREFVSWNWVGNSGTTSANTDGSGATLASTIQANQTAGFSIVRYTGDGGNAARKVAHGLSQAPDWILLKFVDTTAHWSIYHKSLGNTKRLKFTTDTPQTDSTLWNDTSPTSTVFSVGSSYNQSSAYDYIAYCWHSIPGFSKFGSYEGNANSSGPFINLGFKPAWLMIKNIDRSVDWIIIDSKRDPFNDGVSKLLKPNVADAESEANNQGIDLLSNGFKIKQSSSNAFNANDETHVYMAFAEHPFIGDGTNPVPAR